MTYRPLGTTGLQVFPVAFGGNVFGWTLNEAASFRILDALAERGMNFIDTADAYSRWVPGNQGGESEALIGKWLKRSGKRDSVVLATKVGTPALGSQGGLDPAYIAKSVEGSLKRLQTDYIDLYQAHRDDPDTPLEATLEAFDKLVRAGKVRAIGASNYSGARLQQALDVSRANGLAAYATLQPEYNLVERQAFETDLAPVVQRNGLAVINYYALASGFLSGKYRTAADLEGKARGGRVGGYLNERGMAILAALDQVSSRLGTTQAAVALAWLLHQPAVTAPIASATSEAQLDSLQAAANLKLDADALSLLDHASR
ncbi:General stress protein 69 [Pigmentiphaga humi]|uniref:General stress protein 69 n=1 Tax=Pigmentiphaga humi TaxID=2478468 RepID=A0A3P4AVU0_9BURK|nr:aldo/keto reductase [Pigmentiphaga humi]VCU68127.1 General stress protein 69 [Pigmentiphaga humi]